MDEFLSSAIAIIAYFAMGRTDDRFHSSPELQYCPAAMSATL
jgi:hypothetical protein